MQPFSFEQLCWRLGFKPNFKDSQTKGRYGEWLAARYLKSIGYRLLFKNWRSFRDRRFEIDLICFDKEILVFAEVKTRSENSMVTGYGSMTRRKRNALERSFKSFLNESSQNYSFYRFDLVEVDLCSKSYAEPKIYRHENIAIFR